MSELTTVVDGGANGHAGIEHPTSAVQLGSEADLRLNWPFIRRGLVAIKKRQGWRSTWRPEHVRDAIMKGHAELWLGYPATATEAGTTVPHGAPIAFAVTQPMIDPFVHQALGWFVWFAYKDPLDRSDIVRVMDDYLEMVGRFRGYQFLEMLTAREGLVRRLVKHGWRKTLSVVRKDLWLDQDEED